MKNGEDFNVKMKIEMAEGSVCLVQGVVRAGRVLVRPASYLVKLVRAWRH